MMPTLPFLWMLPGIIPSFASSGVMIPGQLGPINRNPSSSIFFFTINISSVGTPSVMQMINSIPESAASKIESLQKGAGTKINAAFGSSALTASATLLNTGLFKWVVPPLPGVTPPTMLVPYSMDCSECNVAWEPVNP